MLELLQIIWEVIFREPDPNTVQFIEPITLGLMAASAAAKGVGSIIKGRQAKKAAERQAELDRQMALEAQAESDTLIADALAQQAEYGLAPTYNELRKTVMEDPAADLQRQEALRSEAEQVQALKTGGARALLGGLERVDESTADRFAKIAAEESARRRAGLAGIAGAEQEVGKQKFLQASDELASARDLRESALGAEADAAALETKGQLAQAQGITEGVTGFLSEGFDMAAQMSGGAGDEDTDDTPSVEEGGFIRPRMYDGGKMTFEEGAALMRGETPGEFSHDRNPIDIMQDGAKIGEMTGGEGIVSPEDMGKMEQLAGKGDTPLHKFVRSWFKKINKKNV